MENQELDKALGGSGEGGEFIWEEFPKIFIKKLREKCWCRGLFTVQKMTSDVMRIPRITGDMTVYRVTGGNAPSAEATLPTDELVLDAEKLMTYVDVNSELEEDARIAMAPIVRDAMIEAMALAEEEAFVNGDTGGAATDHKTICDGLVKLAALANSGNAEVDVAGAALAISHINEARYNLGRYGRDVSQLILLVNPYTSVEIRSLSEVVTVEKYGPKATIVTGEVGKILGITVIESVYIPLDGMADKGQAVLVFKSSPIIGDRRLVKIKYQDLPLTDQKRMVISERVDFQLRYKAGVSLIKNLKNGL